MENDYKYRVPSMFVAVIDLVMTIISIYLLVMFFFLAFALSTCLFNQHSCTTLDSSGGNGFGRFGINFNFEQSYTSYSHSVISTRNGNRDLSGESRAGGLGLSVDVEDSDENELEVDNRNEISADFGKSFPGFGFDNRNRDSSKNKQVDLDFGIDSVHFGKAFGSRRVPEEDRSPSQPNDNLDSFGGRRGNQNQKPSGFEWFIPTRFENMGMNQRNPDPRSKADFLTGNREDGDEKVSNFTRIIFIIIVVVIWIFFVIAVIVEIIMLIAAIRLIMATKKGKYPMDALRSANCWRICTIILLLLFILNFFGGSGRSNLESVVVGGANVLFRVIGLIIVSLFICELEKASQNGHSGRDQVYYDVGESGGGGQMIPMNGNYNNQQGADGGSGFGWNMPKQV